MKPRFKAGADILKALPAPLQLAGIAGCRLLGQQAMGHLDQLNRRFRIQEAAATAVASRITFAICSLRLASSNGSRPDSSR